MREARRTAVWLALLAIGVMAGDRLGAWVCSRILTGSQFRFSSIYRGGTKADIVVVGDSRGVHSFYAPEIERLTGRPVLNLSYNSMSMPIAEALLADYLDRNPPPRVVLIEPTCITVDRGLVSELQMYTGLSPRLEAIYARDHPGSAAVSRLFHLLRYNSEFFLRSLLYLRRSDQDWINRSVIAPELLSVPRQRWRPNGRPENYEAFFRIQRMLRARGIELLLVIAPYHPAAGLDVTDIVRGVSPASRVRNYSDAIGESHYFADSVHMNQDGSEAFLAMLCRDRVLACKRDGAHLSSP